LSLAARLAATLAAARWAGERRSLGTVPEWKHSLAAADTKRSSGRGIGRVDPGSAAATINGVTVAAPADTLPVEIPREAPDGDRPTTPVDALVPRAQRQRIPLACRAARIATRGRTIAICAHRAHVWQFRMHPAGKSP